MSRLGFRRRCSWCGVQLRVWQLNLCRGCKAAVVYGGCMGGPPCEQGSRWDAEPDLWPVPVGEVRRDR